MKICIPSKGRAHLIKTHYFFNPKDVLIFVEPQDVEIYKKMNREYTVVDILENDKGLIYARKFIIDYIDDDIIIMLDDDINGFYLRNSEGRYDTYYDIMSICKDAEEQLKKYAGYTIANLTTQPYSYFDNVKLLKNSDRHILNKRHISAMHCYNSKFMKDHNIVATFNEGEDVDISLQILKHGGDIMFDYNYALDHDLITPGGMSTLRKKNSTTIDTTDKVLDNVREKYGDNFITITYDKLGHVLTHKISFSKAKQLFSMT